MTRFRYAIALSIACSAVPAAALLIAMPAAAKPGGKVKQVEVGPIWNQADAEVKCAKAARKAGGTWTGQWRTTRPGIMSECEIRMSGGGGSGKGKPVEVGPIWNQADAEVKCRKAAGKAGGTWTGEWWTTRPGIMSVCEIKMSGGGAGGQVKTVEVGPIWNQADAEVKCPQAARKAYGRWTGQWWTTQPGRMSVCEIRRLTR